MERDALSQRQVMVLITAALLAPAAGLLPALCAHRGGWIAPLCALPLLLCALWAAGGLARDGGPCRAAGRLFGGLITIIYMVWSLLTLGLTLRLCAERVAAAYGETGAFLCAAGVLLLAVWMALGKASAFARAGEVFYLALAAALVGILLLAAFRVEWGNLALNAGELRRLPAGAIGSAGVLLNVLPAAALGGRVKRCPGNRARAVGWTAAFCVAAALLAAAVTGCLGPRLTTRLGEPFLIMVQGLGVKGAFQRTEALVSAIWTLSDLTMAGLLLHSWRALAGQLHPGKWERWSVIPAAAAAIVLGWLCFSPAQQTRRIYCAALPAAGLLLGLLLPLFLRILLLIRRKKQ